MGHNLILSTLVGIFDHANDKLKFGKIWLSTQWQLQHLFDAICKLSKISNPYRNSSNKVAHPKFVKDIEILVTMGILEERKVLVNNPQYEGDHPEVDEIPDMRIFRTDYRLTEPGKKYIKDILEDDTISNNLDIHNKIKNAAITLQEAEKKRIERFFKLEEDLLMKRSEPDEESRQISKERKKIRIDVLTKACLLVP
jgi:hypothetical protein